MRARSSSSRSVRFRLAGGAAAVSCAVALAGAGGAAAVPGTTTPTAGTAAGASSSVIVILRDQLAATPASSAHVSARRSSAVGSQDAVLARLARLGGPAPTAVTHYTTANALSLTVTAAQAAALAADPAVAQVVPNAKISVPVPVAGAGAGSASARATTPGAAPNAVPTPAPGTCPTNPRKPLLEPEALSDTHTLSDDPSAKTAQQLTKGAGVKVAYIADGINPDNPDFIRADGPAPQSGGEEAFGDASSIAAQGRVAHDLSDYVSPAYPLPKGCTIRIVGMAPAASIVALKIDFYTTSIIQAIDYAVSTDHVDVLNESFGGSPIPDSGTRSAISLFNDLAVAAGTAVTVSSGDAGTTSTIGNPSTDPLVISVAASTNSRAYQQTGYAGARTFGNGTWVNDQISSLSSGGFTQSGGTVDLAAPGEAGWAVCDKSSPECVNYAGQPTDLVLFGGTSQSAPLTAGAAALVISAYRSTHGGASPSPALTKQLLTSTAKDLGLPTFEQGAGLLDARAAVEAALTFPGPSGAPSSAPTPTAVASNVVLSTSQIQLAGAPGSKQTTKVGVRNVGTKNLTVAVSTRDFMTSGVETSITPLSSSSTQTFPYPIGNAPWVYRKVTFTIPQGTNRFTAAMTWKGSPQQAGSSVVTPVVRLTILDPDGSYVANSRPQGGPVSANYANLDVRSPQAGTWTAVLYTPAGATGYTGDVTLQTTSQVAAPVGTVSPAALTLAPGEQKVVTVGLTIPADGDASQAITVGSSDGQETAVAVVERAIVPIRSGRGTFSGTITGGNARAGSAAQSFTYAFDVPAGRKDVDASLTLADDKAYALEGVLVDPHDETQSIGSNVYTGADGQLSRAGRTMQLTSANPVAGRWRLVVDVVNPVPGGKLSEDFRGSVTLDQNAVRAPGLPDSDKTVLARGKAVTVPLRVTNTGIAPVNVQVDARRASTASIPLTSPFGAQSGPLQSDHFSPTFLVPPGTTSLTATSVSSGPALVDLLSGTQGIDVTGDLAAGQSGSTVSVATVAERPGTVSSGVWYTDVDTIGAVGTDGPPSLTTTVNLTARTSPFAGEVTTPVGDFWKVVTDPTADTGAPLTIKPGESATIPVTFTPGAPVGTTVSGVLNVVTPPSFAYSTFNTTGDVIATLPFTYTVGQP